MIDTPQVSVIVPCYNEQETIGLLLAAIEAQTYPINNLEVVIADGMSTDLTRARIAAYQMDHPGLRVQIVNNPKRAIPSGLNRALDAAQGDIIIRLDAHSVPQQDYIERCVRALQSGQGTNVGGVWDIKPRSSRWLARSIAAAAAHPLAVGDAHYRFSTKPIAVDTVPFGAYARSLVEQIGPYDETLLTNEDYEFNVRIRQSGGVVWLDPRIRSTYFARTDLASLLRQYWRYGFWKLRMLRRYPKTLRWRQALPPVFVVSLVLLMLLSLLSPIFFWLLLIVIGIYTLILVGIGIRLTLQQSDYALVFGVPLAVAVMHLSWGSGFLWSLLSLPYNPGESHKTVSQK